MASSKEKTARKESKVSNFLFMPKISLFSFGHAKKQNKEPEVLSKEVKNLQNLDKCLTSQAAGSKLSPAVSVKSSKLSTNSPEIEKLRKNLKNERQKQFEAIAITSTKIPIVRAKISDCCSLVQPDKKFSQEKRSEFFATSNAVESARRQTRVSVEPISNREPHNDYEKFEKRTKSARAENYFRPISLNLDPKCSNFVVEKGTNKPMVQCGLVRERAKAFEQKIEQLKDEVTPKFQSHSIHTGRIIAPRPTSFIHPSKPVSYNFSPSSTSWSSWSGSTPASSTSISAGSMRTPGYSETRQVFPPRTVPQSTSWTSSAFHKLTPVTPSGSRLKPFLSSSSSTSDQSGASKNGAKLLVLEEPLVESDSFSKNRMTSSTTSTDECRESYKTNSSNVSEGEHKGNDYFDDDYKDQPDLTLNSVHETSEGPIATGGGESVAHDLRAELLAGEVKKKNSSLSGSLESLELDENEIDSGNNQRIEAEITNQQEMPISSYRKSTERLIFPPPDDRPKSCMFLLQDVNTIRCYLQKLMKILQEGDENFNLPLESDCSISKKSSDEEIQELNRQISILQQQNKEKDRQIELLKKQLSTSTQCRQQATQTDAITSSIYYLPNEPAINSSGETSSNGSSPISDRVQRDRRPLVRRSRTPSLSTTSRSMTILRSAENGILRIQIGSSSGFYL